MRRCLLSVVAVLALAPGAAAADPLTHGLTQVQRDVSNACRFAGACSDDITGYERSGVHRTLAFQYALAGDVPLRDAPWVGTHNSFNSGTEMGPTVSDSDPNQQLRLVDQLRLDVRSLELDVHWFLNQPVVCHAEGDFTGCSIEKTLGPVLGEISGWLKQHRDQVLLLYLEDHLGGVPGHDAAAAAIEQQLGPVVYRPQAGGCRELPLDLTRNEVAAAGKQVIIVGGCGTGAAYQGLAFNWDRHVENRPVGFRPYPGCGPDYDRATYDATLVRYYEDSTWLTDAGSYVGQSTRDEGLTPQTTAAMVRCGVDLLGFDQLLPADGRLAAAVWSWADGEPRAGDRLDCAVQRPADGRWEARRCNEGLVACRAADGTWSAQHGGCTGAVAATPRTGYENALLQTAAGGKAVQLPLDLTGLARSRHARRRARAGSRSR